MKERIIVVVGHYGSGKTEFSVNYVLDQLERYGKATICDLDIANPYFRSRERQAFLEDKGIRVISNVFGYDITEDLPAVSPQIKAPLQNKDAYGVLDVGGNNSGAMVLNQYREYLLEDDCGLYCVINGNRPETDSLEGCMQHIGLIHQETGIPFKGLLNNTHLLSETTPQDIIEGHKLCKLVEKETGVPLTYDIIREDILEETLKEAKAQNLELKPYPIKLYMRPAWLNRR